MIETGLKGKVVIVTGAASGIGRATAILFAREGCRVAAWDVKEDAGGVDDIVAAGGEGLFQKVNVADAASVESAVEGIVQQWGNPWVLVNNAGVLRDAQLVKFKDGVVQSLMSDEQFDSVVGVNLRGVFLAARAVAPRMIAGGGGVILNASSVVALYGNFGQTNYMASKAGVIGMTRVWARELGRYNIRVNAVAPGFVDTGMTRSMPEKVFDAVKQRTPIGRMGRPEDIGNAYLWLASDAATFVTGTVLSVDGGIVTGT